ncbi:MAG: chorismate mutase [Rhodospirillales bacterium]|nr:chorismate mutase [Rhodospirillales bacterium]
MSAEKPLDALRREIDAIDDSIHDLIMRRTQVVEHVRDLKAGDPVKIRPAREAEILYRLIGRHKGPFPKRELVRIWRELIVATLGFEGPFSVAVFAPEDGPGCWDLARDQYGSFTGLNAHGSAADVINAVRGGKNTIGVLPAPAVDDRLPWWPLLNSKEINTPRIVARLPFAGPSNALGNPRGGIVDGVVICPMNPEPAGRDMTYLAAQSEGAADPAGIEAAARQAGLNVILTAADPHSGTCLIEVDGFLGEGDPALTQLTSALGGQAATILPLGGYARPLSTEDLL